MNQELIEQRFSVQDSPEISLTNIRGFVKILRGEDTAVSVSAIKKLDTGDAEHTSIEMRQESNGKIIIATRYQESGLHFWGFGNRRPCKVEYTVLVPQSCTVHVDCVCSNTEVQEIEGLLNIKTVSGDVKLTQITGSIQVKSVSGDIFGKNLAGDIHLDSVSGNANISESALRVIEASAISGNLSIEAPSGDGPYAMKTVSGDVMLSTTGNAGFSIRYRKMSGHLHNNLPATHKYHRRNEEYVDIHGGGPQITVNSISGDLSILQQGNDKSTSSPNKPDKRTRIHLLERIANGELTAQQGIEELKSLANPS